MLKTAKNMFSEVAQSIIDKLDVEASVKRRIFLQARNRAYAHPSCNIERARTIINIAIKRELKKSFDGLVLSRVRLNQLTSLTRKRLQKELFSLENIEGLRPVDNGEAQVHTEGLVREIVRAQVHNDNKGHHQIITYISGRGVNGKKERARRIRAKEYRW